MSKFYQPKTGDPSKSSFTIWILPGFLITFFYFFVLPVFLNLSRKMQFIEYIPVRAPIGHDFRVIASASSSWVHTGVVPAILYPPFTLIFFTPFTLFDSETGYKILVWLILLIYVFVTLILPQWINRSKGNSALAMLIFVTGLVSYGLQFELERGQWNLIAFTFCLSAVYLFHSHPRLRWLAYLFFTISVQLKLYPAIFVFTLVEDGSDWKNNLKRFAGLGLANLLALFMFGLAPLVSTPGSFVDAETLFGEVPYNLSISTFSAHLQSLGLVSISGLLQFFLFAFFAVCFVIILRQAYKTKSRGLNPAVFLACTLGACLIPTLSFDYKLSFLPAAVMLLLPLLPSLEQAASRGLIIFLTLLFSIAYSSLLYSYANKPDILQYNLPALFVLLILTTLLSFVKPVEAEAPSSHVPQIDPIGH